MKYFYVFLFSILIMSATSESVTAQSCSGATPLFYVDLTGQPNGVWQSPPILRGGDCCGTDVNCIEFIVTLDSMATGILFNIVAGAMPGGALYYQVNCGPLTSIGTPVCLNGPGPHDITFCKPGNNLNIYEIASIPIPDVTGLEWVSEACSGYMSIMGLDSATTVWTSIPPNPLYNSYLSCISGCNNVTVNPTGILPPYVDYQVCGYPIGGCYITPFCDTMRVNFTNTLTVAIAPQNPVICFGGPLATVTAAGTGGRIPYSFQWSNGATTPSINVGAGTYYVTITDSLSCTYAYDSVVVFGMPSAILAAAGSDQTLCLNNVTTQLNGSVVAATGGIWTGGAGTFNPNNTTLNAWYTPSATEISNGSVQLQLITTGNNTCPADTDQVIISISPNPSPAIQGPVVVCENFPMTYSTNYNLGNVYSWIVTGGTIIASNSNTITVLWGTNGPGNISVTETNSLLCDSTVSSSVTIAPQPAPVISGPLTTCTTTNSLFSIVSPAPGNSYSWNISGGTIIGPANGTTINVLWTAPGSASISVIENNIQGCDSTVSITVTVLTMPAPVIAGPDTVCAGQTIVYSTPFTGGNSYTWNVTGGTVMNTNNNSITIQWGAASNGSVSVTETNTMYCDSMVVTGIVIAPQPVPVITGPANTCTTTNSVFSVASPVPGNSYSWFVNGGTIIGPANGSSINIQWITPGIANISVVESNSLGCDSSDTMTSTVYTMPSPAISGPDTVCAQQIIMYTTAFAAGNSYTWNVSGGTVISSSNNTITIQWGSAGNGSVTVTETNTMYCDSSVTTNIVIAPQPIPVITGPANTCTTTNSIFSVTSPVPGNSYSWFINGGTIVGPANGSSINVLWNTPGTATISVIESNSLGCDSSDTMTSTVLTIPSPAISGPDTVCAQQTIMYSTLLVAGNTYTWNVIGGTVISNSNNTIMIQWGSAGNGSVSVTESNTQQCIVIASTNIAIAPQPAPVINGPLTTCTTTNSIYNVSTAIPGNSYSWVVSGGTISGPANGTGISVLWTAPGPASITVTESNSMGCDSTITVPVNVLTLPSPQIAGPDTVCALHTIVYTTPLVAGNSYTWNVTGGTITSNNNNSIAVLWPGNGIGSVSVTESNTATCSVTVVQNIFIAPQPVPAISGSLTSCTSTYSQFTAINTTPGNTYLWTITGGVITGPSNGTSVNIFWNNAGTASLSFTETTNLGCDSTVTVNINALQRPEPEIIGPPLACEEAQETYTVSAYDPTNSYFWSVTNGSIIGLNVGNSIDVLWNNPGTGTVTLRQVSPNGCDSLTMETVVINPLPLPAIVGPSSYCEKEAAMYSTIPAPGTTYLWAATGGIISGSNTSPQITVNWSSSNLSNVYLTATTQFGCVRSAQVPVQLLSKPRPAIQGNITGCVTSLTNNYYTISEPSINYVWSVTNGLITSGNGTANVSIQWLSAGQQSITLTAINSVTGCDSTVTFVVQTGLTPNPVIQAPAFSGCLPFTASFSGNAVVPGINYVWDFGDGSTENGPNPTHNYNNPGTYDIELIASNNTGCADTANATVVVFPVPNAAFNLYHGSGTFYANLSTMTLENLSTGATNYFWTFGNGDNSTEFEPPYQYTEPGNYTIALVVTNQYGCQDLASTKLEVKLPEDIYVPNAFTPNGDNVNDHFAVSSYNIESFQINIFNRWGHLIYTSRDPYFNWDGKHNGVEVENGVYVFSVNATGTYGKNFKLTGTVTVLK